MGLNIEVNFLKSIFFTSGTSHSDSKQLKHAKNKFQKIYLISVSRHCTRFIIKICQIDAGKSITSQFHDFFNLMFGGFLLFSPTVRRSLLIFCLASIEKLCNLSECNEMISEVPYSEITASSHKLWRKKKTCTPDLGDISSSGGWCPKRQTSMCTIRVVMVMDFSHLIFYKFRRTNLRKFRKFG